MLIVLTHLFIGSHNNDEDWYVYFVVVVVVVVITRLCDPFCVGVQQNV